MPRLFHQIARRPELILLGALAWCFLVGEIAERLHLSREMGSLVAGVSLSTFPYALDVTAKVTTLRDFFITLFFVALGMTIPHPRSFGDRLRAGDRSLHGRPAGCFTTFVPLYLMKQGLRASLLPAINLAQISEFSLVVIETGIVSGHIRNRDRQCGVVRIRNYGGPEHIYDDAQRPDHAGCHWPAETDRN